MVNLMKMELYRMFHTFSTWLMMLSISITAVFCVALTVGLSDRYSNAVSVLEMLFHGGICMIFCSIFITIFINAEQKNGYDKNFGGLIIHRSQLVISKVIAVAVEILFAFVLFTASLVVATKVFCGHGFEIGNCYDLLILLLVQYLLHLGFSSFIVFVCILTKSGAFTMVLGILVSCNTMSIIYTLVNKLVYFIGKNITNFDISHFMIDYNIATYNLQASASDTFRTIVVGIVCIIIFVSCASAISAKRDVI